MLLALVAGGLSLAPVGHVRADACAELWPVARAAGQAAQSDAESGGDAGDSLADALPLPQRRASYSWGFVQPNARADFADVEDWYSIDLLGTSGAKVMVEVIGTVLRTWEYPYDAVDMPEGLRFALEAWAPGATSPTLVGTPNGRSGSALEFPDTVPGVWSFRVRYPPALDASVLCGGAHPNPPPLDARSPAPLTNYGVYFGCEPICVRSIR